MAKMCPITKKECLVNCGETSKDYCYIERTSPEVAKSLEKTLLETSLSFTNLNNVNPGDLIKLADQIGNQAVKIFVSDRNAK